MAGVEIEFRQVHRDRPGAAPEGENAVEGAQGVGGGKPGGEHLPQKRSRRLPLLCSAQPGTHPVAEKDVIPALGPRKGKTPVAVGKLLAAAAGGGPALLLRGGAALLRRRVRDTHLRLERLQLPERSGTDVALCYMEGEADEGLLRALREKLMHIQLRSVAMSQETIAEAIAPRQFWNPFPKVRYTERPDVATACIMEGDVVVLVDNSASALLLPTTILRFNEEINDYYFPPLIGTYLQIIRTLVLLLTMFITPLWYLLVKNPDTLHENLRFLLVQDEYYVPLIVQLLLVELIIDILKIASLNTPDVLSNSFSMLGALILGDFAVQARWLVPEVLVYMAFVAVANYAQHSYEMGYATKLCRMLLLVLIWLWDWWGFAAGIAITLTLIVTAKPLVGKGYLYPLIPFDRKKLARLLYRRPVTKKNS